MEKDSFESDLIKGIFYFKNSKSRFAQKIFFKIKKKKPRTVLE